MAAGSGSMTSSVGRFNRLLLSLRSHRKAGVVLLYHRVSDEVDPSYQPMPPVEFNRHCALVRQTFDVLPLAEFVTRFQRGQSLQRCCAITFDDGYYDFLSNAYPILEHHGLPATHFLVEDSVRSGLPTWNLRLARIIARQATALNAQMESVRVPPEFERMGREERNAWLEQAERGLRAASSLPRMLREDDLAHCDRGLVTWGSHTTSHPLLPYCDAETVATELSGSRRYLETVTGDEIHFLAYPNGAHSPEVRRLAQEVGYQGAFVVGQREVRHSSSPYALPRFDTFSRPSWRLGLELNGSFNRLRRLRDVLRH